MLDNPSRNTILLNSFRSMLYDKAKDKYHIAMNDLIRRNSILCGNQQRCAMYRGELLGTKNYNLKVERLPRPANNLHVELQPEVDRLFEENRNLHDEMPHVEGYFHSVFLRARSLNDFLQLIPSALHHPIRTLENWFPKGEDLDDEVIQQFLADNNEYLTTIKRRLALNLLL